MGVGYSRNVLRRALLVLAAAGSGAAIAACGGSSESTGSGGAAATSTQPTTSALTAGEFVDQADAICKQAKGDYLALVRQAGAAAASGESQAKPLQGVADLLGSVESQLADLSPPADLESTFDSYLKIRQNQSAVADRLRPRPLGVFCGLRGVSLLASPLTLAAAGQIASVSTPATNAG